MTPTKNPTTPPSRSTTSTTSALHSSSKEKIHLESLPDTLLHSILSHIPLQQRPTLHTICKHIHNSVSTVEFIHERQRNKVSEDILCIVGGKYPTRLNSSSRNSHPKHFDSRRRRNKNNTRRTTNGKQRMVLEDNSENGIWGYIPSIQRWCCFGGESVGNKYALGDMIDYRNVYVERIGTLLFLGGIDASSCEQEQEEQPDDENPTMDTVWGYNFWSNTWTEWPSMLKPRSKSMFQVAVVGDCIVVAGSDPDFFMEKQQKRNGVASSFVNDGRKCEMLNYMEMEQKGYEKSSRRRRRRRGWVEIADAPCHPDESGGCAVLEERYMVLPGCAASSADPDENGAKKGEEVGQPLSHSSSTSSSVSREEMITEDYLFHTATAASPGLCYDTHQDSWRTLPKRGIIPGNSPCTIAHQDKVLVMGGFHCSDSVMYKDDVIIDYEDHLNHVRVFHPKLWDWEMGDSGGDGEDRYAVVPPLPVAVRGGMGCMHQGRLTFLGGLSSFSQTFHSEDRSRVWQLVEEQQQQQQQKGNHDQKKKKMVKQWKEMPEVRLPLPALLDGYAFSVTL